MTSARIAPLDPPYPPEIQASFDVVMRGAPPLMLFRTVGRNARVLSRLMAGGLLDRGSVTVRQRELMILRVTARARAEYEWGVHVAAYGKKSGFTDAELHASVHGDASAACWKVDEAAIVKLADAACDTGDVNDALWAELKALFSEEQLVELVQLAGAYRSIAFTLNALRVPLEPLAPRFPLRGTRPAR